MIYQNVIATCWLTFLVTWTICAVVFGGRRRRSGSPMARILRLLLVATIFLGVRFGSPGSLRRFELSATSLAAAGAAMCIVGLAFAVWARVTLGRNWGMPMAQHESPELVTSGPYRYVRHPIYTGLITMFVGTSLVYPFAAFVCAPIIAYAFLSALREERDMTRRFPDGYREYKQRSKMLVPFLI